MNAKHIIPALVFVAAASFAQDATWIPADAFGAMKQNTRKLNEKPLIKKAGEKVLSTGLGLGPAATMPLQSISNDVATVLIALLPNANAWSQAPSGSPAEAETPPEKLTAPSEAPLTTLTYICGTFDNEKTIASLTTLPDCKTAVVDGATLYSFSAEVPGMTNFPALVPGMTNFTVYASFPKDGTLVLSEKYETLLDGLKVVNGKAPAVKDNSNIAKAISKDDPLDFVLDVKLANATLGRQQELPPDAPSVILLTLRDKVASPDMLLSVSTVMGSAEFAEQFATQANLLKSAIGAKHAAEPDAVRPDAEPFLKAVSGADISATGNTCVISLTLDEMLLNAILDLATSKRTAVSVQRTMPDQDDFNETHTLPADIAYEVPAENPNQSVPVYSKEICQDDFSLAVLKAFADTTPVDKTLSIDLGSLKNLSETRREFLLDYLAAHPGWWLHKDRGSLCATRRWKVNGNWYHPLHGYYSSWASADEGFAFQTRTTLGFPDFVLGRPQKEEIHFLESKVEIDTTKKQERKDEYICAKGEAVSLTVFDQTKINEHRITRAVLAFLKDEFEKLEKATTREEMMALLPEDAAVKGEDSFILRDGMQPGIYNLTLRVNPGEAGAVYLKAFEVTENLPLSVDRLKDRSNERVGWSPDPEEKFLSEVEFTIYEGDWEKYYAARFEVWFRPASGGEERKLMERVYKIEGWMR